MTSLALWLRRKQRAEAAQNLGLGLFSLLGGAAVLAVTFVLTYAIVWFGFNFGVSACSQLVASKPLHLSHGPILIVCSLFLVLLFIGNAHTSREYLSSYAADSPVAPSLTHATGSLGGLLTLLGNSDASAKIISDLLFSGPRLINVSFTTVRAAWQSRSLDTEGCARALAILVERPSRISCSEMAARLAGDDVVRVFSHLQRIDGVMFLAHDPPAIAITDDLRGELLRVHRAGNNHNLGRGPDAGQ